MSFPAENDIKEPLLAFIYLRGGNLRRVRAEETYEPLAEYFGLTFEELHLTRNDRYRDGRDELLWRNMV